MEIRGLILFKRGFSNDGPAQHYVIAAYHPSWSITWLWLLWWFPPASLKRPFGTFFFARQEAMPRGSNG